MAEVIRGTEVKFNLNIEPIGDVHMSSYDFMVTAYCAGTSQKVVIQKSDCVKVDDDNYTLPVDTSALGTGQLMLDVRAYIPDTDFPDSTRTEIVRLETDIEVIS